MIGADAPFRLASRNCSKRASSRSFILYPPPLPLIPSTPRVALLPSQPRQPLFLAIMIPLPR